jgi:hypothetical protein
MIVQRLLRPAAASTLSAVLAVMVPAGCSMKEEGKSFQELNQSKDDAMAALKQKGAKFTEESYPQYAKEKTWAIDLSGQQVTDDVFELMKKVGYITNLNLSKTNVGDAQMDRLNEQGIGKYLVKLDLSNTAVTDAGLAKLDSLYVIRYMNLSNTKVTQTGVTQFKNARASNPQVPEKFKSPPAIKL